MISIDKKLEIHGGFSALEWEKNTGNENCANGVVWIQKISTARGRPMGFLVRSLREETSGSTLCRVCIEKSFISIHIFGHFKTSALRIILHLWFFMDGEIVHILQHG